MNQTAGTMPEARLRTTKKKVQTAGVPPTRPAEQPQPKAAVSGPVMVDASIAVKPAAKPKTKQKPGAALAAWWPVGVGIFLCGFVTDWHTMAQHAGVWPERLLFPLTLLAQHREIGIDAQMATVMPQWALYLQLPLEGLLTKLTLDRGKGLKAAIVQLVFIHAVSAFVLWLLTYLSK